jgi:hypothetical protein
MLELKGVLEEWRAVPESLEGGWGGDDDLLIGGKRSVSLSEQYHLSNSLSITVSNERNRCRRIESSKRKKFDR